MSETTSGSEMIEAPDHLDTLASGVESEGGVPPDPKLTLKARALAGSPACLNCATDLRGPFCHYCGQPDRNFMRFFPALLREVLSEALEFDSRFMRTMKPLLFKPGRLTRDYLDGKRFRYTPPLRLYLFSSIVFFLLAAFLSSDAIQTSVGNEESGGGVQISAGSEEELQKVEEALAQLPPEVRESIDVDLGEVLAEEREADQPFRAEEISFNGRPWHPVDNPVDVPFFPGWLNDRLNEEVERSPEKAKRINEDPQIFLREFFDILPITMFVLLPIVALILKFWYLFARRFYIEHLILALHNHSFVFVSLVGLLLLELLEDLGVNQGISWLESGSAFVSYVWSAWIAIYLVLSLRTVYQQNWFLTLFKAFMIFLSYVTLLSFVLAVVGLLGFVLV